MKKISLFMLMFLMLVACGKPKYKLMTARQKSALFDEKKTNSKLKAEYDSLIAALKEAANKGDTVALQELSEWENIEYVEDTLRRKEKYNVPVPKDYNPNAGFKE